MDLNSEYLRHKSSSDKDLAFIGLIKLSSNNGTGQVIPLLRHGVHNIESQDEEQSGVNLRRCNPTFCFQSNITACQCESVMSKLLSRSNNGSSDQASSSSNVQDTVNTSRTINNSKEVPFQNCQKSATMNMDFDVDYILKNQKLISTQKFLSTCTCLPNNSQAISRQFSSNFSPSSKMLPTTSSTEDKKRRINRISKSPKDFTSIQKSKSRNKSNILLKKLRELSLSVILSAESGTPINTKIEKDPSVGTSFSTNKNIPFTYSVKSSSANCINVSGSFSKPSSFIFIKSKSHTELTSHQKLTMNQDQYYNSIGENFVTRDRNNDSDKRCMKIFYANDYVYLPELFQNDQYPQNHTVDTDQHAFTTPNLSYIDQGSELKETESNSNSGGNYDSKLLEETYNDNEITNKIETNQNVFKVLLSSSESSFVKGLPKTNKVKTRKSSSCSKIADKTYKNSFCDLYNTDVYNYGYNQLCFLVQQMQEFFVYRHGPCHSCPMYSDIDYSHRPDKVYNPIDQNFKKNVCRCVATPLQSKQSRHKSRSRCSCYSDSDEEDELVYLSIPLDKLTSSFAMSSPCPSEKEVKCILEPQKKRNCKKKKQSKKSKRSAQKICCHATKSKKKKRSSKRRSTCSSKSSTSSNNSGSCCNPCPSCLHCCPHHKPTTSSDCCPQNENLTITEYTCVSQPDQKQSIRKCGATKKSDTVCPNASKPKVQICNSTQKKSKRKNSSKQKDCPPARKRSKCYFGGKNRKSTCYPQKSVICNQSQDTCVSFNVNPPDTVCPPEPCSQNEDKSIKKRSNLKCSSMKSEDCGEGSIKFQESECSAAPCSPEGETKNKVKINASDCSKVPKKKDCAAPPVEMESSTSRQKLFITINNYGQMSNKKDGFTSYTPRTNTPTSSVNIGGKCTPKKRHSSKSKKDACTSHSGTYYIVKKPQRRSQHDCVTQTKKPKPCKSTQSKCVIATSPSQSRTSLSPACQPPPCQPPPCRSSPCRPPPCRPPPCRPTPCRPPPCRPTPCLAPPPCKQPPSCPPPPCLPRPCTPPPCPPTPPCRTPPCQTPPRRCSLRQPAPCTPAPCPPAPCQPPPSEPPCPPPRLITLVPYKKRIVTKKAPNCCPCPTETTNNCPPQSSSCSKRCKRQAGTCFSNVIVVGSRSRPSCTSSQSSPRCAPPPLPSVSQCTPDSSFNFCYPAVESKPCPRKRSKCLPFSTNKSNPSCRKSKMKVSVNPSGCSRGRKCCNSKTETVFIAQSKGQNGAFLQCSTPIPWSIVHEKVCAETSPTNSYTTSFSEVNIRISEFEGEIPLNKIYSDLKIAVSDTICSKSDSFSLQDLSVCTPSPSLCTVCSSIEDYKYDTSKPLIHPKKCPTESTCVPLFMPKSQDRYNKSRNKPYICKSYSQTCPLNQKSYGPNNAQTNSPYYSKCVLKDASSLKYSDPCQPSCILRKRNTCPFSLNGGCENRKSECFSFGSMMANKKSACTSITTMNRIGAGVSASRHSMCTSITGHPRDSRRYSNSKCRTDATTSYGNVPPPKPRRTPCSRRVSQGRFASAKSSCQYINSTPQVNYKRNQKLDACTSYKKLNSPPPSRSPSNYSTSRRCTTCNRQRSGLFKFGKNSRTDACTSYMKFRPQNSSSCLNRQKLTKPCASQASSRSRFFNRYKTKYGQPCTFIPAPRTNMLTCDTDCTDFNPCITKCLYPPRLSNPQQQICHPSFYSTPQPSYDPNAFCAMKPQIPAKSCISSKIYFQPPRCAPISCPQKCSNTQKPYSSSQKYRPKFYCPPKPYTSGKAQSRIPLKRVCPVQLPYTCPPPNCPPRGLRTSQLSCPPQPACRPPPPCFPKFSCPSRPACPPQLTCQSDLQCPPMPSCLPKLPCPPHLCVPPRPCSPPQLPCPSKVRCSPRPCCPPKLPCTSDIICPPRPSCRPQLPCPPNLPCPPRPCCPPQLPCPPDLPCSPRPCCPPQLPCPPDLPCPPRPCCPPQLPCPPDLPCPPRPCCKPQLPCPPDLPCPPRPCCPPQLPCPPDLRCPPRPCCPPQLPCPLDLPCPSRPCCPPQLPCPPDLPFPPRPCCPPQLPCPPDLPCPPRPCCPPQLPCPPDLPFPPRPCCPPQLPCPPDLPCPPRPCCPPQLPCPPDLPCPPRPCCPPQLPCPPDLPCPPRPCCPPQLPCRPDLPCPPRPCCPPQLPCPPDLPCPPRPCCPPQLPCPPDLPCPPRPCCPPQLPCPPDLPIPPRPSCLPQLPCSSDILCPPRPSCRLQVDCSSELPCPPRPSCRQKQPCQSKIPCPPPPSCLPQLICSSELPCSRQLCSSLPCEMDPSCTPRPPCTPNVCDSPWSCIQRQAPCPDYTCPPQPPCPRKFSSSIRSNCSPLALITGPSLLRSGRRRRVRNQQSYICGQQRPCLEPPPCVKPPLCLEPAPCHRPCLEPQPCVKIPPCLEPTPCRRPCVKPLPCLEPTPCHRPCVKSPPCLEPAPCHRPCVKPPPCLEPAPCHRPCVKPPPCSEPAPCQRPCLEPPPCVKPRPYLEPAPCHKPCLQPPPCVRPPPCLEPAPCQSISDMCLQSRPCASQPTCVQLLPCPNSQNYCPPLPPCLFSSCNPNLYRCPQPSCSEMNTVQYENSPFCVSPNYCLPSADCSYTETSPCSRPNSCTPKISCKVKTRYRCEIATPQANCPVNKRCLLTTPVCLAPTDTCTPKEECSQYPPVFCLYSPSSESANHVEYVRCPSISISSCPFQRLHDQDNYDNVACEDEQKDTCPGKISTYSSTSGFNLRQLLNGDKCCQLYKTDCNLNQDESSASLCNTPEFILAINDNQESPTYATPGYTKSAFSINDSECPLTVDIETCNSEQSSFNSSRSLSDFRIIINNDFSTNCKPAKCEGYPLRRDRDIGVGTSPYCPQSNCVYNEYYFTSQTPQYFGCGSSQRQMVYRKSCLPNSNNYYVVPTDRSRQRKLAFSINENEYQNQYYPQTQYLDNYYGPDIIQCNKKIRSGLKPILHLESSWSETRCSKPQHKCNLTKSKSSSILNLNTYNNEPTFTPFTSTGGPPMNDLQYDSEKELTYTLGNSKLLKPGFISNKANDAPNCSSFQLDPLCKFYTKKTSPTRNMCNQKFHKVDKYDPITPSKTLRCSIPMQSKINVERGIPEQSVNNGNNAEALAYVPVFKSNAKSNTSEFSCECQKPSIVQTDKYDISEVKIEIPCNPCQKHPCAYSCANTNQVSNRKCNGTVPKQNNKVVRNSFQSVSETSISKRKQYKVGTDVVESTSETQLRKMPILCGPSDCNDTQKKTPKNDPVISSTLSILNYKFTKGCLENDILKTLDSEDSNSDKAFLPIREDSCILTNYVNKKSRKRRQQNNDVSRSSSNLKKQKTRLQDNVIVSPSSSCYNAKLQETCLQNNAESSLRHSSRNYKKLKRCLQTSEDFSVSVSNYNYAKQRECAVNNNSKFSKCSNEISPCISSCSVVKERMCTPNLKQLSCVPSNNNCNYQKKCTQNAINTNPLICKPAKCLMESSAVSECLSNYNYKIQQKCLTKVEERPISSCSSGICKSLRNTAVSPVSSHEYYKCSDDEGKVPRNKLKSRVSPNASHNYCEEKVPSVSFCNPKRLMVNTCVSPISSKFYIRSCEDYSQRSYAPKQLVSFCGTVSKPRCNAAVSPVTSREYMNNCLPRRTKKPTCNEQINRNRCVVYIPKQESECDIYRESSYTQATVSFKNSAAQYQPNPECLRIIPSNTSGCNINQKQACVMSDTSLQKNSRRDGRRKYQKNVTSSACEKELRNIDIKGSNSCTPTAKSRQRSSSKIKKRKSDEKCVKRVYSNNKRCTLRDEVKNMDALCFGCRGHRKRSLLSQIPCVCSSESQVRKKSSRTSNSSRTRRKRSNKNPFITETDSECEPVYRESDCKIVESYTSIDATNRLPFGCKIDEKIPIIIVVKQNINPSTSEARICSKISSVDTKTCTPKYSKPASNTSCIPKQQSKTCTPRKVKQQNKKACVSQTKVPSKTEISRKNEYCTPKQIRQSSCTSLDSNISNKSIASQDSCTILQKYDDECYEDRTCTAKKQKAPKPKKTKRVKTSSTRISNKSKNKKCKSNSETSVCVTRSTSDTQMVNNPRVCTPKSTPSNTRQNCTYASNKSRKRSSSACEPRNVSSDCLSTSSMNLQSSYTCLPKRNSRRDVCKPLARRSNDCIIVVKQNSGQIGQPVCSKRSSTDSKRNARTRSCIPVIQSRCTGYKPKTNRCVIKTNSSTRRNSKCVVPSSQIQRRNVTASSGACLTQRMDSTRCASNERICVIRKGSSSSCTTKNAVSFNRLPAPKDSCEVIRKKCSSKPQKECSQTEIQDEGRQCTPSSRNTYCTPKEVQKGPFTCSTKAKQNVCLSKVSKKSSSNCKKKENVCLQKVSKRSSTNCKKNARSCMCDKCKCRKKSRCTPRTESKNTSTTCLLPVDKSTKECAVGGTSEDSIISNCRSSQRVKSGKCVQTKGAENQKCSEMRLRKNDVACIVIRNASSCNFDSNNMPCFKVLQDSANACTSVTDLPSQRCSSYSSKSRKTSGCTSRSTSETKCLTKMDNPASFGGCYIEKPLGGCSSNRKSRSRDKVCKQSSTKCESTSNICAERKPSFSNRFKLCSGGCTPRSGSKKPTCVMKDNGVSNGTCNQIQPNRREKRREKRQKPYRSSILQEEVLRATTISRCRSANRINKCASPVKETSNCQPQNISVLARCHSSESIDGCAKTSGESCGGPCNADEYLNECGCFNLTERRRSSREPVDPEATKCLDRCYTGDGASYRCLQESKPRYSKDEAIEPQPRKSSGNIIQKSAVPDETPATVPEETKAAVPEETKAAVPEETKAVVPEQTKVAEPEVVVPEEKKIAVPEEKEDLSKDEPIDDKNNHSETDLITNVKDDNSSSRPIIINIKHPDGSCSKEGTIIIVRKNSVVEVRTNKDTCTNNDDRQNTRSSFSKSQSTVRKPHCYRTSNNKSCSRHRTSRQSSNDNRDERTHQRVPCTSQCTRTSRKSVRNSSSEAELSKRPDSNENRDRVSSVEMELKSTLRSDSSEKFRKNHKPGHRRNPNTSNSETEMSKRNNYTYCRSCKPKRDHSYTPRSANSSNTYVDNYKRSVCRSLLEAELQNSSCITQRRKTYSEKEQNTTRGNKHNQSTRHNKTTTTSHTKSKPHKCSEKKCINSVKDRSRSNSKCRSTSRTCYTRSLSTMSSNRGHRKNKHVKPYKSESSFRSSSCKRTAYNPPDKHSSSRRTSCGCSKKQDKTHAKYRNHKHSSRSSSNDKYRPKRRHSNRHVSCQVSRGNNSVHKDEPPKQHCLKCRPSNTTYRSTEKSYGNAYGSSRCPKANTDRLSKKMDDLERIYYNTLMDLQSKLKSCKPCQHRCTTIAHVSAERHRLKKYEFPIHPLRRRSGHSSGSRPCMARHYRP